MDNHLQSIIKDLLTTFYQSFWFVLLLAVLFMFAYKSGGGLKGALKQWWSWFKREKQFRRVFFLAFYTAFVLFRTLFNRTLFSDPLSNVIGEWRFYKETNGKTVIITAVPENLMMLVPFIFLLFLAFRERIFKSKLSFPKTLWYSFIISFLFSLTIETLQLFLHLGTWQLSDLFYNTSGGIIGGLLYFIAYIIVQRYRKSRPEKYNTILSKQ